MDSLNVGGLENGVVNIINNSDRQFKHAVCCIREIGKMADRISPGRAEIYLVGKTKKDYLLPWKLLKIIKRIKPDIVHTRNWGTIDGILAAALARVKVLVHGEHGRDYDDTMGQNLKRNIVRRMLSPFVNQYITVSDDLRSWLSDTVGINGQKVSTIINGVDTIKFSPTKNKPAWKKKMGVTENVIVIGSVGRLDIIKNYPLLISIMADLKNRGVGVEFECIIIGDGSQRSQLEKLIKKIKAPVKILGSKEHPADYLKAFDIFILPSFNEGISNTILEAMACGLPVIASNVGGNPELIESEISGYLVESGNEPAFSEAVKNLLTNEDLRKKMGKNARIRAMRIFSLHKMVNKYEYTYRSLFRLNLIVRRNQ